jgi:hypothetical protein
MTSKTTDTSEPKDGRLDKINKVLPLVQWILGIVIAILGWGVTMQFKVNGHDEHLKAHGQELKEYDSAIRTLEVNESGIFSTLKSIDKKLDQIDSKLDK